MRWVMVVLLVLTAEAVAARMYQWVDPDTGTPYLSGTPPAWYRSGEGGPRVQVWEGDRLIDDTQTRASAERAERLREQARQAAQEREEAARRQAALRKVEERRAEEPETGTSAAAEFSSREEALEVVERAMQWVVQQAARSAVNEDLLQRFAEAQRSEGADTPGEGSPAAP